MLRSQSILSPREPLTRSLRDHPLLWERVDVRRRPRGCSPGRGFDDEGAGRREAPRILFFCGASSSAPRGGDIAQFVHSSASGYSAGLERRPQAASKSLGGGRARRHAAKQHLAKGSRPWMDPSGRSRAVLSGRPAAAPPALPVSHAGRDPVPREERYGENTMA
jgi:hypothetical protein